MSYEAGIRGWGGLSNAHVAANPYFDLLKDMNVHFYDEAAVLKPMFHVSEEMMAEHSIFEVSELFDLDNVEDFVEFEPGEGVYGEVDVVEEAESDDALF